MVACSLGGLLIFSDTGTQGKKIHLPLYKVFLLGAPTRVAFRPFVLSAGQSHCIEQQQQPEEQQHLRWKPVERY